METEIIGIVGNILYLAPFYAGDHVHSTYMTDSTKEDFIERGVIEYPSYDYIEAILHGFSNYEEYLIQLESWKNSQAVEEVIGLLSF